MLKPIKLLLFLLTICSISSAQNGVVKSYYPDGATQSEISYVNDVLDGNAIWYYQNGKVMLEKNYSKGVLDGWVREYYENGKLKNEYFINNGSKDGLYKSYYENGELKELLSYVDGKQTSRQTFELVTSDQVNVELETDTKVEKEVAQNIKNIFVPAFPIGGKSSIQEKLKYPEIALSKRIEGIVTLDVVVDPQGDVLSSEVKKGIGFGCDEAAQASVRDTKFRPAQKNGNPIISNLLIDVEFKLPSLKEEIAKAEVQDSVKEKLITPVTQKKIEEHLIIICEADRCPQPVDDLQTIYSKMEIPTVAKALQLVGTIIIEGFVNKEGILQQTKIVEGIGYGCDQQVESALLRTKFSAAIKNGESIETKIIINFPFKYEF